MQFTAFVDRITKRKWNDELIRKYIGETNGAWFLHAKDEAIRNNAASGGVISAILSYLLQQKKIDGALVLKSYVEGNQIKTQYKIATTKEEIKQSQGSKYINTNFAHDAVPLIKAFNGKLALVLLPCDTKIINRLRKNDPELDQKIVLTIALFCGHVSEPGLSQLIIKKTKPRGKSLTDFRYRAGHWRGKMQFHFEDDTHISKSFSVFSDYQNLYFYCAKKCFQCHDHTGYECDLSIGDVWLMKMKANPIKHNAVISRTAFAKALIEEAQSRDILGGETVQITEIADAQSRSLPLHYNVTARAKAGKWHGIKIQDTVNEKVRLVDFLVAYILIFNYKLSNSPKGRRRIEKMPKSILKAYLYFLKALEVL